MTLNFDIPLFTDRARDLGEQGAKAGNDLASAVQSNLAPPPASSPAGNQISAYTSELQVGLSGAGPKIVQAGNGHKDATEQALSGVQTQDQANGSGFPQGGTPGAPGPTGSDTPGELDPESIDSEAKEKAEEMLGSDQTTQMMQQVMQAGLQAGTQMGQQLSQQLSQLGSKMGEFLGQAGQQMSQMLSKGLESAGKDGAALDQDLGGSDFGGGAGGSGGGGEAAMTTPAGMERPVTPINASSALQQSSLPAPGAAATAPSGMNSRMPMMPMMPMHGKNDSRHDSTKRDPNIFPEAKIYDPPQGVEQTYGAHPEIALDEPPFGTSSK